MVNDARPIVFIINSLMRGGAQRLVVDDIHECMRRGIPVRLVTLESERPYNSLASECSIDPADWIKIPYRSLVDIRAWRQLIQYLSQVRPRLVCTHLWFSNTIGRIAARLARVPVVIAFEHNVYQGVKHAWQYLIDVILAHWTDRIIAVSAAVKEFLMSKHIASSRIVVMLNGLDLQRYAPRATALKAAERERLGLPLDKRIFMFIGRLTPQKGLDILLRAFHDLANTDTWLVLIGEGQQRDALRALAHHLGIESRVQLLGVRSDIPDLLRVADVFVLPSRWEGLGMVLLEAMAAGVPVLASAAPAIQEVVSHERNGLLVPVGDQTALMEGMKTYVERPAYAHQLAEQGLRDVQRFSIARHVETLFDLLTSCEERT